VTVGGVRDGEWEGDRGWTKGIGRFRTLTPRGSDGDELLGKLRRGRHCWMDGRDVALRY
jgi:hypothetical protein